ncbi:unnamed protein product [Lasius platythorax]|uniref:Uncharacterized protein n=1 Tax=Lasius platythorax TaxID=488582 RepID=A0AAV2P1M1_9HYME
MIFLASLDNDTTETNTATRRRIVAFAPRFRVVDTFQLTPEARRIVAKETVRELKSTKARREEERRRMGEAEGDEIDEATSVTDRGTSTRERGSAKESLW